MRLNEIEPKRGSLEDLVVWGINPLSRLLELQAREIEGLERDDADSLLFFVYEMQAKLEDLREALLRFERPAGRKAAMSA